VNIGTPSDALNVKLSLFIPTPGLSDNNYFICETQILKEKRIKICNLKQHASMMAKVGTFLIVTLFDICLKLLAIVPAKRHWLPYSASV
jgi:hypothetical protein